MKSQLIVLIAISITVSAAFGEEATSFNVGKIEVAPFRVKGFTIGKKLVFGDAYAEKHGRPAMKAPFEVMLPKNTGSHAC